MEQEIKSGQKFVHFKGEDKIYEVLTISLDCENPRNKFVVYKQLYDSIDFPKNTTWIRQLQDFIGYKKLNDGTQVKRFKLI